MLSPTSQRSSYRTFTISAVLAVTIIILLSLYNLRDARVVASSGSPVRVPGDGKDHVRITKFNNTKIIHSLATTLGNEQETASLPEGHAEKVTTSLTHMPGNEQDTAKLPNDHAPKGTTSFSQTPGNEQDTAKSTKDHIPKLTTSLSHTPVNEQNSVKVPANIVSSSAIAATSAIDVIIPSTPAAPNSHRRAFVTFLEADTGTNRGDEEDGTNPDDEDIYFVAARVLGYQLMHQPETRSNTSIPYVVVVSNDVSQSKRTRLEKDGAKVVVVDSIEDPKWLDTKRQYQGVMTKLRVFQQTEYEKMLYMDADMLITRRMDAIFEDEAAKIQPPKEDKNTKKEKAPLPPSFLFAGQAQQGNRVHKYPPDPSDQHAEWMCSGFMVFQPSQEIFKYYTSIMERPNSFDPEFPDQNLLNYAHRWDGPMPWTNVYYKWTSTYPTIKEYAMGAAALHEKYWMDVNRSEEEGQNILGDMWLKAKSDMEAFYKDKRG